MESSTNAFLLEGRIGDIQLPSSRTEIPRAWGRPDSFTDEVDGDVVINGKRRPGLNGRVPIGMASYAAWQLVFGHPPEEKLQCVCVQPRLLWITRNRSRRLAKKLYRNSKGRPWRSYRIGVPAVDAITEGVAVLQEQDLPALGYVLRDDSDEKTTVCHRSVPGGFVELISGSIIGPGNLAKLVWSHRP